MNAQQRRFWAIRKREEADGLIKLAMRLEDITPRIQMATYRPQVRVLVETAIGLQDDANQLDRTT